MVNQPPAQYPGDCARTKGSWRALEEAKASGQVVSISTANAAYQHGWELDCLENATTVPVLSQVSFPLSLSSYSHNHTLTHSHTLLITCTCCVDLTKGAQDKDFSYSFSILSLCGSIQSHTHIHSLPLELAVMMKSKELKTKIYSHAHSLILSLWKHTVSAEKFAFWVCRNRFVWAMRTTLQSGGCPIVVF